MLKKIGSSLITFIMLISITTFSSLLILRTFLSGDNLGVLVGTVATDEDGENYLDEIIKNSSVTEEEYQKISEYLDEEEFERILGAYVSDYIKYESDIPNAKKPNTKEFKEYIENIKDKYEEETGTKIEDQYIDDSIKEFETEMEKEKLFDDSNQEVKLLFQIIYSNSLLISIGVVILICLAIIYLINRSIRSAIKYSLTALILNSISLTLLGFALNTLGQSIGTSNIDLVIFGNLSKTLLSGALISIVVSIILIISLILTKNKTKMAK